MSEGVQLNARNQPDYSLKQAKTAAFGTVGINVTAKPGRVYRLTVLNTAATAYFVQIHDKATAPTAGNVPVWERRLAVSSEVDIDFALAGLYVANGYALALSTTAGTLTLAAASDAVAYTLYTTAT